MKNFKRALRRHHRARIKKARQYHWGYGRKERWANTPPENAGEINFMTPRTAGFIVNTAKPCSCHMCCNPRRSVWSDNPLTMQELKALDNFHDQMDDLDNV